MTGLPILGNTRHMPRTHRRCWLGIVGLGLGLVAPTAAAAQSPAASLTSEIVTTGSGRITLPPDRAVVRIGIATRAATASAASTPNAPLVARVQDTLRALHHPEAAIRVVSFGVAPNYDYQNGRRLVDYEARTTLEVTLQDIAALGRLLDAALAGGATDISGVVFESDSVSGARQRALGTALAAARADAETLARAAGGRLGSLRVVSTSPESVSEAMAFRAMDFSGIGVEGGIARGGVPAVRRDVVVAVLVAARWNFVPSP
jgi:uncharacterized protein YggE